MRRIDAWALVALSLVACSVKPSSKAGTDSSSHWLRACERDSECGAGLVCRCNVCTRQCEQDEACTDLAERAVCAVPEGECGRSSGSLCLLAPEAPEAPDASPSDDALVTDASSPPILPVDAASPELVSTHCAYPSSGRNSAPSGIVTRALEWSPRPSVPVGGSAEIQTSCGYALSEGVSITLDDTDGDRVFAFSYDVNGDQIDDLFIRNASVYFGAEQVLELWVSHVEGGQLTYHHEPCDVFGVGSGGYHYFVRDIDADGVPDVIVGLENGILALRNTPAGFEPALAFDFGGEGWSSLLDVALGDVTGDAALDLVVGFDRVDGSSGGVEFGVMAFPGTLGSSQFGEDAVSWLGGLTPTLPGSPQGTPLGEFAIHESPTGSDTLVLQVQGEDGSGVEFQSQQDGRRWFPSGGVEQVWSTSTFGSLSALAISSQREAASGWIRWYLDDGLEVGAIETLLPVGTNRELGGGGAWRDNQFVLDADGNTSADFVELTAPFAEEQRLAIHLGDLIFHFQAPHVLELPRKPARRAFPFAAVQGHTLGLVLYDGVEPSLDTAGLPPMVQQLRCAP